MVIFFENGEIGGYEGKEEPTFGRDIIYGPHLQSQAEVGHLPTVPLTLPQIYSRGLEQILPMEELEPLLNLGDIK